VRGDLRKLERKLRARRRALSEDTSEIEEQGIVVRSPAMRAVMDLARRVAPVDSTVLITGPTGAGTPGASWSAFTTVAAGADIPGTTRYLQYRATLTTNSTRNTAPVLSSVQLGFAVP
jgi:sigma54-dependent transcription regulator